MNKKLLELLNKIQNKKNEVKTLAEGGKIDEAKAAKKELIELQDKFDILKDLEDEEDTAFANKAVAGQVKHVGTVVNKGSVVRAFVNVFKNKFTGSALSDEDRSIYQNSITTSKEPSGLGSDYGLGVTVPEDIRTDITELRRSSDNLEQYVTIEPTTTSSGKKYIEEDAEYTPWDNVEEEAAFPEADEPKFVPVEYKISKKGGILKVTRELLEDTAENIMSYLKKWIAKKTKATRNAFILKKADEITTGKEVVIKTLDDIKDIFNVSLDPAIAEKAIVVTNQDGYNWLDKLKDANGRGLLEPDPTAKTKLLLFGKYPIVRLSNKTLKSKLVGGSEHPTGEKYPIYCGSMEDAITLIDRQVLSIDFNDKGDNLWGKDLTGIKARDRFDVQAMDKAALKKGEVEVTFGK